MGRREKKEEKTNKKLLLLLLLLLLIIIIAIIVIIFLLKYKKQSFGGIGLYVDKNAGEYVAQAQTETEEQNVAIPGWGSISIPENEKKVKVNFMNPKENEGLYYLTFELRVLNNSEQGYEVLYTSGLVEPGLYIQNIELTRALSEGVYDAVVHVQPYRMDENKTPTNNADMKTKLIVK